MLIWQAIHRLYEKPVWCQSWSHLELKDVRNKWPHCDTDLLDFFYTLDNLKSAATDHSLIGVFD